MSALAALADAIEKAGLITPGRRPIHQRIAFLLSTATGSSRRAKIGQYLETRKRGKAIPGTRKPRKGLYTGVYATGINKAGETMSAIAQLDAAIEKAGAARRKAPAYMPKGRTANSPRSGMIPYGSSHQYSRAKFFEARAKRAGETLSPRAKTALAYLANRYKGGKGPGGRIRTGGSGIYKAVADLRDAIAKAKGAV